MDELVDILDSHGVPTGKTCMKSEAHRKGYWHPCVHIWLFNKNEEVLIQRRVANKDTFPDRWDISVAGHIGAGENPEVAAIRELSEELGVEVNKDQLEFVGDYITDIRHSEKLIDREFHFVYIVLCNQPVENFKLQEEEVAETKWISLARFKEMQNTKSFKNEFVPYTQAYYNMVFHAINSKANGVN